MNPMGLVVTSIASISGLSIGLLGIVDGIPIMAGGGFAVTAGLQLWTMGKLGPIHIRLAVIEERLNRMEDMTGRRRTNSHPTPPIE